MKKLIGILLFLLAYLLAFPAHALESARLGLLLWYRSVLPVLFPFMLISGLLIRFDVPGRILPAASRPLRTLFGCSPYGAFAILTGFLCGFPMGAKVTADLRAQGKISAGEAETLYGFVNNLSPAFILSYLAADQMRLPALGWLFLLNILGPALILGLCGARRLRRLAESAGPSLHRPEPVREHTPDPGGVFDRIDECIYDTVQNTVRLGAYIVMFSILCGAVTLLLPQGSVPVLLLTSCIEVSNGVHLLSASALPLPAKYLAVSMLGAFGGLSALAQTASVASMDRRLLLRYIKSRVTITLLSAVLSVCSLLFGRLLILR